MSLLSLSLCLYCSSNPHSLLPTHYSPALTSFTTPRPWAFEYSEFCVLFNVFCGMILVLLHAKRWILFRRAIFIYTIINIYRLGNNNKRLLTILY